VATGPSDVASVKEAAAAVVDRHLGELVALSHAVHDTPELCFGETASAQAVAAAMRSGGLQVDEGVYDLPTALESRTGEGELVVAVCAEYDALPDVGHACGHNIIAATAVGAGLALASVADQLGLTVRVLGTPAEEGGGGKVLMLERGAFAGVHAAMMVHPWPTERLTAQCLAVAHYDVRYRGREAHASAAPWEGVNAQDALTVAQVAIGLLRQQLPPGDQVHGVVIESSAAANVIPAAVTARYMVRAPTAARLAALRPRIDACFEAGALATGCTLEYEELSPVYSHMEADPELLRAYRANAEALGRRFEADDAGSALPTFSTDMANVSLAVPTIHPLIGIETHGAVNHQREFAAACVTPSADAAVRDGAVALAWTAIDAAGDPALRARLLDR
jgi:amidohydrolase